MPNGPFDVAFSPAFGGNNLTLLVSTPKYVRMGQGIDLTALVFAPTNSAPVPTGTVSVTLATTNGGANLLPSAYSVTLEADPASLRDSVSVAVAQMMVDHAGGGAHDPQDNSVIPPDSLASPTTWWLTVTYSGDGNYGSLSTTVSVPVYPD